jgi:mRNA interferase RelE/StbE
MKFEVEYTSDTVKGLQKMDQCTRKFILAWIEKNLVGCTNPRQHGKPFVANRFGQWRYCIGDYRLLAEIDDEKIVILIIAVGHRKDIYK